MEEKMKKLALPVIGLVALVLVVIACGGSAPVPTPPPAEEILNAADEAMSKLNSLHIDATMVVTITSEGFTAPFMAMTFAGNMQNPDRVMGTGTLAGPGGIFPFDMAVIGDTTYFNQEATGWEVVPSDQTFVFDPLRIAQPNPEEVQDLIYVGEETVGGRPGYHLSGKVASGLVNLALIGQDGDISCNVDYWIDQENSYLLKMSLAGNTVLATTLSGPVDISMTTTFSDYNKPVTIEVPDVSK
jgi:LppX_LprAFG lipoprotein